MSLVILSLIQYFGHMVWRTDSLGRDPDAGKYWWQEEKETTEDEVVRWHHQLNGHGFEQALYVDDDREAWCAVVHEVAKCWTQLSNWTELVLDHLAKEVVSRFIHSKVIFFLSLCSFPFCSLEATSWVSLYWSWEEMVVEGIKHHFLEEVECIFCNFFLLFSSHSHILLGSFLVVTIKIMINIPIYNDLIWIHVIYLQ